MIVKWDKTTIRDKDRKECPYVMVSEIIFGLHTGEIEHKISRKEMEQIKAFFNLTPNDILCNTSYFYKQGITQLEIVETVKQYNGENKQQYTLKLRLNFSRIIGGAEYEIMPLTVRNIKKVITRVNKILQKILPLQNTNNQVEDWIVDRLDSAFDIYMKKPQLFIILLNFSLQLPPKQKSKYLLSTDSEKLRQQIAESIRFGNDSYIYNIYVKLIELMKRNLILSDEERNRLQDLLRVEKQHLRDGVKRLLGNKRRFGILAEEHTIEDIKRAMISDIEIYFGKGNFYSAIKWKYKVASKGIDVEQYEEWLSRMERGILCWQQNYPKELMEFLKEVELAPTIIPTRFVESCQVDEIQGLYNMIIQKYPLQKPKRVYHEFPVPCRKSDGRFSAVLSLPSFKHYPSVKKTIAKPTLEEYEREVYREVMRNYLINRIGKKSFDKRRQEVFIKSGEYIVKFRNVVQTEEVKAVLDKLIEDFLLDKQQNT